MTCHRRDVLGALGAASASTLLWALGCGPSAPNVRRAPQVSGEVRTWLHDAVARLAAAHPFAHGLAVSRRRTTAARDVLGAGIARQRAEGAVLTIRDRDGTWREHVTSALTRDGIADAARALGAARTPRAIDFGRPPATPDEPPPVDDRDLAQRVELLLLGDAALAPRMIYSAGAIDLDDAIVWSVAPGRDLEQRLVRIRQTAVRAAFNGTRPVVRHAERAWSGWLDDHPLTPDDLDAAGRAALELLTPGAFDDGERSVVLDPSVTALVVDAAARGLLTAPAATPAGTPLASPLVTVLDDPTARAAYGGFAFDDEGEPAAPLTLVDAGRIAAALSDRANGGPATSSGGDRSSSAIPGSSGSSATLGGSTIPGGSANSANSGGSGDSAPGRGRRAGHLGPVGPAPSHLHLVPGTADPRDLQDDGFLLEGGLAAFLDPGTGQLRVACARARELKAGNTTGRLYADVELTGSLTALLTAVDAVAANLASFVAPPVPRSPAWRSISAPSVRTRGLVRARWSRA